MADSRSQTSASSIGQQGGAAADLRREVVVPRRRDQTATFGALALAGITATLLAGLADAAGWHRANVRSQQARVVAPTVAATDQAPPTSRSMFTERCAERLRFVVGPDRVAPGEALPDERDRQPAPSPRIAFEEVSP